MRPNCITCNPNDKTIKVLVSNQDIGSIYLFLMSFTMTIFQINHTHTHTHYLFVCLSLSIHVSIHPFIHHLSCSLSHTGICIIFVGAFQTGKKHQNKHLEDATLVIPLFCSAIFTCHMYRHLRITINKNEKNISHIHQKTGPNQQ